MTKVFIFISLIFFTNLSFASSSKISYKMSLADDKSSSVIIGDYLLKNNLSDKIYNDLSSKAKNILTTNLITKDDFNAIVVNFIGNISGNFYNNSYNASLSYNPSEATLISKIINLPEDDRKILSTLYKNSQNLVKNILMQNKNFAYSIPTQKQLKDHKNTVSRLYSNALMGKAVSEFATKNYEKAKSTLTYKELAENPTLLTLRNIYAGRLFLMDNNLPQAEKYLEIAYDLNDSYSISTFYYASYLYKNNKSSASRYFAKMKKLEPKIETLLYQSALYLKNTDASDALDLLNEAIKIKPTAENLYELATIKGIKDKDYMVLMGQSVELKPNFYKSYVGIAKWYEANGNLKNAIYNMKVAYSIKQDDIDLLIDLGNLYSDDKNIKLALLYYQQAAQLNDKHPRLLELGK